MLKAWAGGEQELRYSWTDIGQKWSARLQLGEKILEGRKASQTMYPDNNYESPWPALHRTDLPLELDLDSGCGTAMPWSCFGEAIPLVIWRCASGHCHVKRWSVLAEALRARVKIDSELFIIASTLTKALVPAEEKQLRAWCCHRRASPWECHVFGDVFFWVSLVSETY